jgi:DNA-binding response OmpR family regulator
VIKIFYVEDDEALSFITKDQLEEQGYEVHHFAEGMSAVKAFLPNEYDLAILDIMLPNIDGFEIASNIRKTDEMIPILFLSAKSLEEDRLKGFEIGADDYLTKPFSMEELLYKIKVFLKRSVREEPLNEVVRLGDFTFDTNLLKLQKDDDVYDMTSKEADLLLLLLKHKNQTVKREDILIKLWGKNDYFLGRSLDVFISRLRKYLSSDNNISIETQRGVGFRLDLK